MIIVVSLYNGKLNIRPVDEESDEVSIEYCNVFQEFVNTFGFQRHVEVEPFAWEPSVGDLKDFVIKEFAEDWGICIRWKNDRVHIYTNLDDEVALIN